MSRFNLGNSPFLLGFEHTEALIERLTRSRESYPPYNVELIDPHHLVITLSVAGFAKEALRIEHKGQELTVYGSRDAQDKGLERDFIHRGIAKRGFMRSFVLGQGLRVGGARLGLGWLHIDLYRPPESDEVKTIEINLED